MMKKLTLVTVLMLCIAATSMGQVHKAALISVFGSRNLSGDPLETKLYMEIMKDSSFNLVPVVNKFEELIRTKFLPEFPFPFMSKEEVVTTPGYQDLVKYTRWASDNCFTTPADYYVPIAAFGIADDEKAINKAFEILPGDVDVVMIAYLNFQLYDAVGVGGLTNKKVHAYVNLKLFDRKLDRVFKLKEGANSDKGMAAYGGFVLQLEKVMPLIENASENLFEDMKEKLPKSLKKMTKKLHGK
jgi:hypothetical protein